MENQIPNWLTIAQTAKQAGNNEEAIAYFNKILEVDLTYADAWLGKGQCSFLASTLANLNIKEAWTYFEKAIESATVREDMVAEIGFFLTKQLVVVYDLGVNHYNKFKETNGAREEFLFHIKWIADTFYKFRKNYDYADKDFLEKGTLIFTLVYKETSEEQYNSFKNKFVTDIKALDPNYKPPKVQEGCFIATAVYGSYDDASVMELRRFRDERLRQTSSGRKFITIYYRLSPAVARVIENNESLKAIVRWVVIKPLVKLVRLYNK